MTRPDIKWFPGIGQLEEWRMDIQSRITTASGLSSTQVGEWVCRPWEPACTLEELDIEMTESPWLQALEDLLAEVLLDLLRKKQQTMSIT